MKRIVLRSDKVANIAFASSDEIDAADAETYRKRFLRQHQKDRYGYWFEEQLYRQFLTAIGIVATNNPNRNIAIGLQPGRASTTDVLDFSMEPIIYDIDAAGSIINLERFSDRRFFGKLASNFRTNYDNISGSGNLQKIDLDKAIREPGPNVTKLVLVEYNALNRFSNIAFDSILVEFAVNDRNRLTTIFSRYDSNGNIVATPSSSTIGLFLDDNDLLP